MSVCGVGAFTASALAADVGDLSQFKKRPAVQRLARARPPTALLRRQGSTRAHHRARRRVPALPDGPGCKGCDARGPKEGRRGVPVGLPAPGAHRLAEGVRGPCEQERPARVGIAGRTKGGAGASYEAGAVGRRCSRQTHGARGSASIQSPLRPRLLREPSDRRVCQRERPSHARAHLPDARHRRVKFTTTREEVRKEPDENIRSGQRDRDVHGGVVAEVMEH